MSWNSKDGLRQVSGSQRRPSSEYCLRVVVLPVSISHGCHEHYPRTVVIETSKEEKNGIWLSPLTKTFMQIENSTTNWQHRDTIKIFDYTMTVYRLRTVNWSNNIHPTGMVKPGLKGTNLLISKEKCISSRTSLEFSRLYGCRRDWALMVQVFRRDSTTRTGDKKLSLYTTPFFQGGVQGYLQWLYIIPFVFGLWYIIVLAHIHFFRLRLITSVYNLVKVSMYFNILVSVTAGGPESPEDGHI